MRWHLQGARRKNHSEGMNVTLGEFTTMLGAWPRSSDSPDEVILFDYCLKLVRCGMHCVPVNNVDRSCLNHGRIALCKRRPLIRPLHPH